MLAKRSELHTLHIYKQTIPLRVFLLRRVPKAQRMHVLPTAVVDKRPQHSFTLQVVVFAFTSYGVQVSVGA